MTDTERKLLALCAKLGQTQVLNGRCSDGMDSSDDFESFKEAHNHSGKTRDLLLDIQNGVGQVARQYWEELSEDGPTRVETSIASSFEAIVEELQEIGKG
jgi:hypothetical protein